MQKQNEIPTKGYAIIRCNDGVTRTAKITNTGKPELAEESGTPNIPVTGVTLDKATASVAVGATTTLNVTVNPASASDASFRVATSDGAEATVTVSGNAITVNRIRHSHKPRFRKQRNQGRRRSGGNGRRRR